MTKQTAYIGLGSNLGDREKYIRNALKMLTESKQVELLGVSDLIETTSLSDAKQPDYLNGVAEIKTTLSAEDLHGKMAEVENSLGRVRQEKHAPRTIDLDLLLFGQSIVNLPDLTIPHRRLHLRSFVLKGLCQLNDQLVHPVLTESIKELAARLNGADFMLNPGLPQLISVAGVIGVGKTTLTQKLSELLGCKTLFEAYDTNPFMPDVYAGQKKAALDSQLFFLTSRTEQLNPAVLTPGRIVVSDYVFGKELIYAKQLLNPRQLVLYEKIYQPLHTMVAEPALVIYLQDSMGNCLERIHKRNRPYEQKIELQFLEALNCGYERLFRDWKTCPVICKQTSEFDCTQNSDIEHLANQIKSYVAI